MRGGKLARPEVYVDTPTLLEPSDHETSAHNASRAVGPNGPSLRQAILACLGEVPLPPVVPRLAERAPGKGRGDVEEGTNRGGVTLEETAGAGSASVQGELWGARAHDWAEVQEAMACPLYLAVLDRVRLGSETQLCDVGCGSGHFCELAARRGASVTGIDAAATLIELARARVTEGEFRVGEMEQLPYDDESFDVVTGFNSFQYAADPVHALREAGRIARYGGSVVVATWGKPEDCEAAGYLAALGSLLPPPPAGAAGPFALCEPGALEALAAEAGLGPQEAGEAECPFVYPDLETALRGLLSAGPAVKAIAVAGEEQVRDAVMRAIAPFASAGGGYRLENTFRYLVAIAE